MAVNRRSGVSAAAAPDWEVQGSEGRVTWHDHRIHAGAISRPLPWTIPLTVDGVATVVRGELRTVPAPSPLPWLIVAAIAVGAVVVLGRRRPQVLAGWSTLVGAVLALVTGGAEWSSLPSMARRPIGLVALPLVAAGLSVLSLVVTRPVVRRVALLASVSLLAGWVAFRWSILTSAVLVSTLAPSLDRLALATILGLAVGAAGLTVLDAGQPEHDRSPGPQTASAARFRSRWGPRPGPAPPGPSPRGAG